MRFTVGQLLGGRHEQWANRKPLPVCWTGFFEDATSGHLYRHHSKVRRQVESSAAGRRHQRADAAGGPGGSCHFRLFALVSSARGSGPGRTEASMLTRHLAYWLDVLQDLVPHGQPRIELSVFATPRSSAGRRP
jgi:hypothetical protein